MFINLRVGLASFQQPTALEAMQLRLGKELIELSLVMDHDGYLLL